MLNIVRNPRLKMNSVLNMGRRRKCNMYDSWAEEENVACMILRTQLQESKTFLFYFILFYFILFYFILFHFILFYFTFCLLYLIYFTSLFPVRAYLRSQASILPQ